MSDTKIQGAQMNPIELAKPVAAQKTLHTQLGERITTLTSSISKAVNGAISNGASLVNRVTRLIQSHPFASLSLLAGMIGSVVGARYFLNNSPIIQPTGLVDIGSINPQCVPTDFTCEKNLQPLLPSTEPRLLIAAGEENLQPLLPSTEPRLRIAAGPSPSSPYTIFKLNVPNNISSHFTPTDPTSEENPQPLLPSTEPRLPIKDEIAPEPFYNVSNERPDREEAREPAEEPSSADELERTLLAIRKRSSIPHSQLKAKGLEAAALQMMRQEHMEKVKGMMWFYGGLNKKYE